MPNKIEPREGHNAAFNFSTYSGAHPSIQVNNVRKLTPDRVIAALQRLRARVLRLPLDGYDDTTVGNKSTECTWGLCSHAPDLWPEARDHIWPYSFLNEGRVAPLDIPAGSCPMQDMTRHRDGNGCFWSCKFFSTARGQQIPSRQQYLDSIDAKIKELQNEH